MRGFAATVLPGAGAVLVGLAAGFAAHSWWWARGLVGAEATVVENVESLAPGGEIVYTPQLRFRTAAGALVVVLTQRGEDEVDFPAGKTVPVLYDRRDPQNAVIATVMRVYSTAVWLAVVGLVLFDVGWVLRRTGSSGNVRLTSR